MKTDNTVWCVRLGRFDRTERTKGGGGVWGKAERVMVIRRRRCVRKGREEEDGDKEGRRRFVCAKAGRVTVTMRRRSRVEKRGKVTKGVRTLSEATSQMT